MTQVLCSKSFIKITQCSCWFHWSTILLTRGRKRKQPPAATGWEWMNLCYSGSWLKSTADDTVFCASKWSFSVLSKQWHFQFFSLIYIFMFWLPKNQLECIVMCVRMPGFSVRANWTQKSVTYLESNFDLYLQAQDDDRMGKEVFMTPHLVFCWKNEYI